MSASLELNPQFLLLPYKKLQKQLKSVKMEWNKNKPSEKKLLKEKSGKKRRTMRADIYRLWQEELEEKGFNKLNRLKQGLL